MDNAYIINGLAPSEGKTLLEETLFTLGNGYMAIRGTHEISMQQGTTYPGLFLAGVFDYTDGPRAGKCIVNFPDVLMCDIIIDGEQLSFTNGCVENYNRTLNMKTGLIKSEWVWCSHITGKKIKFCSYRFLHIKNKNLILQQICVKAINFTGTIELKTGIDGTYGNTGGFYNYKDNNKFLYNCTGGNISDDKTYNINLETKIEKHNICIAVKTIIESDNTADTKYNFDADDISGKTRWHQDHSFAIAEGEEIQLTKYISVFNSPAQKKDSSNIIESAVKSCNRSAEKGFVQLLVENTAEWNKLWDISDIQIDGPFEDLQGIRYAIFNLYQNCPTNSTHNISSRGISSEMHNGGCFWDTEIFMLPFYIFNNPDAARNLVEYRYLTLDGAKEKAKKSWCKGACYPWISIYPGYESEPLWEYASGHHITGDVVYGLRQYFTATNDHSVILDFGLEILIETSRFWETRVTETEDGKFGILGVKGPNEYDGIINNNLYTNYLAKFSIDWTIEMINWANKHYTEKFAEIADRLNLSISEIVKWQKVADRIILPFDVNRDLWLEDDSFLKREYVDKKKFGIGSWLGVKDKIRWEAIFRYQVCKQADVLMLMYLFPDFFTFKQKETAYDFYEKRTVHHSSLSYCTHSIIAAWLGKNDEALNFFRKCNRLDLDDEMGKSFFGIHAANTGGVWKSLIFGFAGMKISNGELEFKPNLPVSWKSLKFKIFFKGKMHQIKISGDDVYITN